MSESIESKWNNLKPAAKRNVILSAAAGVVIIVFYMYASSSSSSDKKEQRSSIQPKKPEVTLLLGKETKEVGMDVMLAKITMLESQLSSLERKQSATDYKAGNQDLSTSAGSMLPYEGGSDLVTLPGTPIANKDKLTPNSRNATPVKLDPTELASPQVSQQTPLQPMPSSKPTVDLTPIPYKAPKDMSGSMSSDDTQSLDTPVQPAQAVSRIKGFTQSSSPSITQSPAVTQDGVQVKSDTSTNEAARDNLTPKERVALSFKQKRQDQTQKQGNGATAYIPPGTIISGVLVTGVDATTSATAKTEPLPALFRIKHEAILPNYQLMDIRECFMLLAAYGDISSERAYIRSENLSCVTNDNKIIDTKIDSYASGEDGKAGLRGRVVTKAGAIIAKATLAGFVEGIANIFKPSKVSALNVNPSNTAQYQVPDTQFALTQGAFSGAQNSANLISDYFLKQANNLFPIIEIDAGRKIDFIVTKGVSLTPRNASDMVSQQAINPVQSVTNGIKNAYSNSSNSALKTVLSQQPIQRQ